VLLDYHLQKLGISSKEIMGYALEEYTHLAVAAAVASGRADCGLGVTAAAIALDLDFVPLFQERYDLVVPQEYAGSDLLQPLWNLMDQQSFQKEISALPGYDTSPMGKVFLDESMV
jgi:putative molybdopterin biosynthesis protein